MPVKIRLQRHGKKGKPFYWIVAADSRSKRDGKYLEKLGSYNPNVNPPIIELDIDGSVKWLQNGAQPTHTARNILSYKGAMLKHHLLGGVAKGALTLEEAETKLAAWLEEKTSKIVSRVFLRYHILRCGTPGSQENVETLKQHTQCKVVHWSECMFVLHHILRSAF